VTIARSTSPNATLTTNTGRVFAVIPRSKIQTSPRVGCILFLVEETEERLASLANLLVGNWAGIERQFARPSQDFHGESLFVVYRKSIEGFQELNPFACS